MSGPFPRVKNPKKMAAGSKGGKMRQAPNRETIQAQRKKHIMEMRMEGRTFAEIAAKLGLDRATCWRLHDEVVEEALGDAKNLATRLRNKQLVRLEMVEVRLLKLLLDPKLKVRKTAVDGNVMELADFEALNKLNASLVKNYERQAKLAGADAPVKIEQAEQRKMLNAETLAAIVARGKRSEEKAPMRSEETSDRDDGRVNG